MNASNRTNWYGAAANRVVFVLGGVSLALVLAAALAGPSHAQVGTIVLRGVLPLAPSPSENSDVWGWVDPATEKEYAIVGEFRGTNVRIIDVTNPQNPILTSTISTNIGQDLKTWGNYLYLVDGNGTGIDGRIYDISNPASPVFVGSFESGHNITIDDNGILYKSGTGLKIYDLKPNPASPQFLWSDERSSGHDATAVGNRLYDAHGGPVNSTSTYIYDITDPSQPIELGWIPTGVGIAYHHNCWPSADGNYLYISDELSNSTRPDITVWDISNPAGPVKVDEYKDANATVHNILRVGDLLLCSFYVAGFKVFDISNPANLVLVDEYDTAPGLTGDGDYDGAWGCYPFAPSGNVYVSDMRNGLFVFTVEGIVSVFISAFDAVWESDAVTLRWAVGSADGLMGFNIYRARGREDFERVNTRLLSASERFEYVDASVEPGVVYRYRLGAVDRDGEFFSQTESVSIPSIRLSLMQNYPNPFNPVTTITYELPQAGEARLVVYDAAGRRVRVLVAGTVSAGRHTVAWDGRDDAGTAVASGTYFYRLESTGGNVARNMVLLK